MWSRERRVRPSLLKRTSFCWRERRMRSVERIAVGACDEVVDGGRVSRSGSRANFLLALVMAVEMWRYSLGESVEAGCRDMPEGAGVCKVAFVGVDGGKDGERGDIDREDDKEEEEEKLMIDLGDPGREGICNCRLVKESAEGDPVGDSGWTVGDGGTICEPLRTTMSVRWRFFCINLSET
jgi:hypothetical protein